MANDEVPQPPEPRDPPDTTWVKDTEVRKDYHPDRKGEQEN